MEYKKSILEMINEMKDDKALKRIYNLVEYLYKKK